MQTTFVTVEALRFATTRSSELIGSGSAIRIAAVSQREAGVGKWQMCRLDWRSEPVRAAEFVTDGLPLVRPN